MHESVGVTASIYRLEQIVTTNELKFYVYGELIKTVPRERLLTYDELFDTMCSMGREYQERNNGGEI